VALELSQRPVGDTSTRGLPFIILAVVLLVVGGGLGYYLSRPPAIAPEIPLTPDAREYVQKLKLEDVSIKANETYVKQLLVEIEGKVTNTGDRNLDVVEIYCVFVDSYGQLVLRKRVPIVSVRMGGLKPGETKSFRLPFDDLPESWNQAAPRLVIAGIKFS
jgi:Protein of unknown function (DUF3426)